PTTFSEPAAPARVTLMELGHGSRLKIAGLQLDVAIPLPFADARAEGEAAVAGAAHQLFQAVAHAEADGAKVAAGLADAKRQVPLAAAQAARLADNLQASRQEHRLRIAGAVRLQVPERLDETGRQ